MDKYTKLNIVNSHLSYDNVSLIEPSTHYYLQLAVEVDTPLTPFFFFDSSRKKKIIKKCKHICDHILKNKQAIEANVFKAILTPPGSSKFVAENKERIHIAKFDVALLIEFNSLKDLMDLKRDIAYLKLYAYLKENSNHIHETTNSNARRIGDVDHSRQGVFLFNYFYADDVEQNLEVWNYTAGWFEKETGLDNSTLFLPTQKADSDYSVINHCRWDGLRNILPSLIFKKSFNHYVLDNFYINQVGAMPILYKLVF